ncbi:MAG: S-adenosylmethionine:tRNA ribosyltransferase-isomerase [Cyclobacteriaceae bacterium]
MKSDFKLSDFNYDLPDHRIAKYPLNDRSASKLLVYEKREVRHSEFSQIAEHLPGNSMLVFNNTRVIPARLIFKKSTGALIEIFLLDPIEPSTVINQAMEATTQCTWHCLIGNLKRWKEEYLNIELEIDHKLVGLRAVLTNRDSRYVQFIWNSPHAFADIVEAAGKIPLPPYLNREPEEDDAITYQTVYSKFDGAVAAPTAGLHFTDGVLNRIKKRDIKQEFLTLHVGAGTFRPIKADKPEEHDMHSEQMVITRQNIINLLNHEGPIIPVGTTSLRTLESLYWFGVKCSNNVETEFQIKKLDPYNLKVDTGYNRKNALKSVLEWMDKRQVSELIGHTEIFIFPGYHFKMCDALITNFHQPGSTLILLVAAFIGDAWKRVYDEALENNYRFLSYGDSSILMP